MNRPPASAPPDDSTPLLHQLVFCALLSLAAACLFMAAKIQIYPGVEGLLTFDGEYYRGIYLHGYSFSGDIEEKQAVAYLPLSAAALGLADVLVPGNNAFLETMLLGVAILFLTLLGIYRLTSGLSSRHTAMLACTVWALSPVAIYNFVGYTEPLYAALTVWILYHCWKHNTWTAAALAGIAMLGRPQAAVLALFVAGWIAAETRWRPRDFLDRNGGLKLVLMAAPLMLYASWAAYRHDDSILYINALEAWRRGTLTDGNVGPVEAILYFFRAIAYDHSGLTQWTAALGTLSLLLIVACVSAIGAVPRWLGLLYGGMLVFWFSAVSFDAMNSARHLFFMAPWAIIATTALSRLNGGPARAWLALLPWLLIACTVNHHAVIRYYSGQWVS